MPSRVLGSATKFGSLLTATIGKRKGVHAKCQLGQSIKLQRKENHSQYTANNTATLSKRNSIFIINKQQMPIQVTETYGEPTDN